MEFLSIGEAVTRFVHDGDSLQGKCCATCTPEPRALTAGP